MTTTLNDANGKPIRIDDVVTVLRVPDGLVNGLPAEDQAAIRQQVGRPASVQGFDDHGNVEVEFKDTAGIIHTIWIDPGCLKG